MDNDNVTQAAPVKSRSKKDPLDDMVKVRMFHLDEPENKDLPISLTVNVPDEKGKGGSVLRRSFLPGQEVDLPKRLLNVARDAVISCQVPVPHGSAVYEAGTVDAQKRAAEVNWPGFRAVMNQVNGTINMIKRTPRFSIEYLEAF